MRHPLPALTLAAGLICSAGRAQAGSSMFQPRPDWNLGVSWGFGAAHINGQDVTDRGNPVGAAPSARLGHMLGSKTMLSLNWENWLVDYGMPPAKMHRGMQMLGVGIGFFPGNPTTPWGGWFVRGGAGIASAVIGAKEAIEDTPQGLGTARFERGVGYFAETGYEIRLPRNFSAGLKLTSNYYSIGDVYVNRAAILSAVLDLGVYF